MCSRRRRAQEGRGPWFGRQPPGLRTAHRHSAAAATRRVCSVEGCAAGTGRLWDSVGLLHCSTLLFIALTQRILRFTSAQSCGQTGDDKATARSVKLVDNWLVLCGRHCRRPCLLRLVNEIEPCAPDRHEQYNNSFLMQKPEPWRSASAQMLPPPILKQTMLPTLRCSQEDLC